MNFPKRQLRGIAFRSLATALGVSLSVAAQGPPPQEARKSCGEFVQRFYDWYVPFFDKFEGPGRVSDFAVTHRKSIFNADLVKALLEDSAAQDKAKEIVGLDFDPFLNAQDVDGRYVVGNVKIEAERCWAELHSMEGGGRKAKPTVVPELARNGSQWVFVNFHYPEFHSDLMSILKSLKASRRK